ncbi:MAG: DUF5698 domain-containing protein [Ignavibacteriaceae bacterium]|jgi:uncharacterized protein YebE (UPF0316 family)|nr:DUF5698 domain-containing protein [Ignavibacteriaceae bacterium]
MEIIAALSGAFLIMVMRICDVTIGTFRTLLVVQGKKYEAAIAGFFEVLIWIYAMRYIVEHMDKNINLFGYAIGFALGNVLGITLEQYFAIGYVQVNIISLHFSDKIATALRKLKYGVTILPAEGGTGGTSILIVFSKRKHQKKLIETVEKIDEKAFITINQARPYRGFFHASRK